MSNTEPDGPTFWYFLRYEPMYDTYQLWDDQGKKIAYGIKLKEDALQRLEKLLGHKPQQLRETYKGITYYE